MKNMTKLLVTLFSIVISVAALGAANDGATNTFIETYDDGTDVGLWHCSVGVPRDVETNGGNPGAYLQQGGFSTSIPTWAGSRPAFSVSERSRPNMSSASWSGA